jgi:hypothetical protein
VKFPVLLLSEATSLDILEKRKISCLCQKSNNYSSHPAPSLVTILTLLSQLCTVPEKNKDIHLTVKHRLIRKTTQKEPGLEHKSVSNTPPSISGINIEVIQPIELQLE